MKLTSFSSPQFRGVQAWPLDIAEAWLERAREAMERVKVKRSTFITDCSRHSIFKCQSWVLFNLVVGGEREAPLRLSEFCPSSARL